MNLVDILIILFLIYGLIIGWKNGLVKQLVFTVGLILLFVLSYSLKDSISIFFYKHLPFLSFDGVESLNIVLCESLSFILIFIVLLVIFRLILRISNFAEKILKFSALFVSKIFGSILGVVECFIITFFLLFILNLPFIKLEEVKNSKLSNYILNKTVVLSKMCDKSLNVYEQINELKNEYKGSTNKDELNNKIVNLTVKKEFISKENLDYLIKSGKIQNVSLEE